MIIEPLILKYQIFIYFVYFFTVICFDDAFQSRISVALKYNELDTNGKVYFLL
jgi:hypothetical protein